MDVNLFRGQFLLTKENGINIPWPKTNVADYNLFVHPDLDLQVAKSEKVELYLLGNIYDYKNPDKTNNQIISTLAQEQTLELILNRLAYHSGHFALIMITNNDFVILNDACAQFEIYYDTNYNHIASQPKLLSKYFSVGYNKSKDAYGFYNSEKFNLKKLYIGDTTQYENVKHLTPNHLIDLSKKQIERYFPNKAIKKLPLKEISELVREMLKGFIEAAANRNKIAVAVTGGYDSRILFLSSKHVKCSYYVTKLDNMSEDHYDITVAKQLASTFDKDLIVQEEQTEELNKIQEESIDYTQYPNRPGKGLNEYTIINGNLSEIARNYFGYHVNLNANDLEYFSGNKNKFVNQVYSNWINKSKKVFKKYGFDLLDMFYWEEKMGIWAAKSKTEMRAIGVDVFSPYCSHQLLSLLLSTKRKNRDSHFSLLYNRIIKDYSNKALRIPINPTKKNKIIVSIVKLKLFKPLYIIGLKLRLLGK